MSLLDSSYGTKHLFRIQKMTVVDIQPNVTHGGLLPFFRIHEVDISYPSKKKVMLYSRMLNVAFFKLLTSEYKANIPRCKPARFWKWPLSSFQYRSYECVAFFLHSTKDLLKHRYYTRYVPCYAFIIALCSDIIKKCVWLVVTNSCRKVNVCLFVSFFSAKVPNFR